MLGLAAREAAGCEETTKDKPEEEGYRSEQANKPSPRDSTSRASRSLAAQVRTRLNRTSVSMPNV